MPLSVFMKQILSIIISSYGELSPPPPKGIKINDIAINCIGINCIIYFPFPPLKFLQQAESVGGSTKLRSKEKIDKCD